MRALLPQPFPGSTGGAEPPYPVHSRQGSRYFATSFGLTRKQALSGSLRALLRATRSFGIRWAIMHLSVQQAKEFFRFFKTCWSAESPKCSSIPSVTKTTWFPDPQKCQRAACMRNGLQRSPRRGRPPP